MSQTTIVRLKPSAWANIPDPSSLPDDGTSVLDHITDADLAHLHATVRALPLLERQIVRFRYGLDGTTQTFSQIATRLGVSTATVHTVHARALEMLRDTFALNDPDWATPRSASRPALELARTAEAA